MNVHSISLVAPHPKLGSTILASETVEFDWRRGQGVYVNYRGGTTYYPDSALLAVVLRPERSEPPPMKVEPPEPPKPPAPPPPKRKRQPERPAA